VSYTRFPAVVMLLVLRRPLLARPRGDAAATRTETAAVASDSRPGGGAQTCNGAAGHLRRRRSPRRRSVTAGPSPRARLPYFRDGGTAAA